MNSMTLETRRRWLPALLAWALFPLGARTAVSAPETAAPSPPLGANVHLIDAHMPVADIQRLVDVVAARQRNNQFGPDRDAVLFEPGTYGSPDHPLTIPVGYYTELAGLGSDPRAVVIHGRIQVRNRCSGDACLALDNFWRSVSNLTLHVVPVGTGCESQEIFAVSQAAPVRRLNVTGGNFWLADFCTQPSWASGGFIADSVFDGAVENGGQQQYLVRNSQLKRWVGGNWNQLFAGVQGDVPACPSADAPCAFTTLPASPVIREAPYLYRDATRQLRVFRPGLRVDAAGPSWGHGPEPGNSQPLSSFFVAMPGMGAAAINRALQAGKNLLLTPGIYRLDEPLQVTRDGSTVLGLGFPTLIPQRGTMALHVRASHGVAIAGVLIEAGPVASPVLLQIGDDASGDAADPSSLHDVFFRIGGPAAGRAAVSLQVKNSHVILDHLWAWRADHGEGVGWSVNTADTGLVVDGAHVTAYGLFVEHYQKQEVLWNGEDGRLIFFQNELPYDPPSQSAWQSRPGEDGYAALVVAPGVNRFSGVGLGSYSYFNQHVPVFAEHAFEVPAQLPAGSVRNAFTIFLNAKASGGIRHVINEAGGLSDRSNPDIAVRVAAYP